ncbi:MAG: cob(I)yrinic acid a,c-diamide adenosyltransferase [Gemmatimonadetes bacterium]|nr:cob(I)yrinic acid a,c-diamide adenosyltransferase [Gemmatimonadota bacterium]
MKIYTRTGDLGETGLFGGGRVAKDHVRVEAYGAVDELNSLLGLVIRELGQGPSSQLVPRLRLVQGDLLSLGASLATPTAEEGGRAAASIPPLPLKRIGAMEEWMDAAEAELEPLREFILPGGTEAAARLHLARTVCRRAERRVVALAREARVDGAVVQYLNRLSDLLFVYARLANRQAGAQDEKWDRNA